MKQVDTSHYDYLRYESPERFTSYYYQLRAVLDRRPASVLEIGRGSGIFQALAAHAGITAYSVDIDVQLRPSVCGSVLALAFADASVDLCVAFQILEHLPFATLARAAGEIARVCRDGAVISLPEHGNAAMTLSLPYVRKLRFTLPRVSVFKPRHRFDGEHYWELNKRGYDTRRVIAVFQDAGLACERTWLNPYNPYHRFFQFRRIDATDRPERRGGDTHR